VSAYPETIVQYRKIGYRKFLMGGVAVDLPFVQLYPFGEPLYFYLLTFCDGKENVQESYWDAIRSIGQGMKEALEFIHKHNICHNDISDKNIVAKNGKPVLMDFGNAAGINDKQVGFHGTTEYAHCKIHQGSWHCQKHYDWTGTMATILNG